MPIDFFVVLFSRASLQLTQLDALGTRAAAELECVRAKKESEKSGSVSSAAFGGARERERRTHTRVASSSFSFFFFSL